MSDSGSESDEFYSADEDEQGDHHHHHHHHHHRQHHNDISEESKTKFEIDEISGIDDKGNENGLDKETVTKLDSLETSCTDSNVADSTVKVKPEEKTITYAQSVAGFILCANGPPVNEGKRMAEDQPSHSTDTLEPASQTNSLQPISSSSEIIPDKASGSRVVGGGQMSDITSSTTTSTPLEVRVTKLDVPAYLDLSDKEGFRYTSYRIAILKSDGKVTHVLKRFNQIADMYSRILKSKCLEPKNHKLLKSFNFPHKSMLNTFSSHTLERRRSGFAGFLQLLLSFIQQGDHGCLMELSQLLKVNPQLITGISSNGSSQPEASDYVSLRGI